MSSDVPYGTSIFVDANVFIYAIVDDSNYGAACKSLLARIDEGELLGHTSTVAVSNMAHRVMTIDASPAAADEAGRSELLVRKRGGSKWCESLLLHGMRRRGLPCLVWSSPKALPLMRC